MSEVDWHRSEPRAVRPFFQARAAEDAVAASTIRLFANEEPSEETSFTVDELDLPKLAITVFPDMAPVETWLPDGYKTKDFEVVVLGRSPRLKRSRVIWSRPASIFAADEVPVSPGDLAWLGGGRDLRLTVAVCLAADKPPIPGAPSVVGHWLASKTFALREKSVQTLFDVQQRDDQQWIAAGYPAKTVYAVEYTTGIVSDEEDDSSVAVVYVHKDAFNAMAGEKVGDVLQPVMAADIVAQVLEQSRAEWAGLEAPPAGSPMDTLLRKLEGSGLETLQDLKSALQRPAFLRAVLQDRLAVLTAIATGG